MASFSSLLNGTAAISRKPGAPESISNAFSSASQLATSMGRAKDVIQKKLQESPTARVGASLLNPAPGSTTLAVGKEIYNKQVPETIKPIVNVAGSLLNPVPGSTISATKNLINKSNELRAQQSAADAQKQAIAKKMQAPNTQTTPITTSPITTTDSSTSPTSSTSFSTTGGASLVQNPDGTFSLANPPKSSSSITAASTESPTSQRDLYLKQILDSMQQTPDELSYQEKLANLQAQQANLAASEQLGLNKIQDQPIAMPFITGQQAALQRNIAAQEQALGAQQVPLQTRIAQLQAERARKGELAKLGFESEKPIEVGGQLVNPNTGAVVFAGTPKEDKITAYQQAQLDIEREKMGAAQKPTEAQSKASLFAARAQQANPVLDRLGPQFTGVSSVVGGVLPNIFKGENRQLFEQAEKNFINAVLRRESGAAISPSEFSNARSQYIPQPGDTAAVLAQKKTNRDLVQQGLTQEAGKFSIQSGSSDFSW